MDAHENARTTPRSRMLIVERLATVGAWRRSRPAWASPGDRAQVARPLRRRGRGRVARPLLQAPSQPGPSAARRPPPGSRRCAASAAPARPSPARLGLPGSTVGLALRRLGLGRLAALDPKPAIVRYEREHPGELIHLDTKKLGRIDGVGHRITGDRAGRSSKRGAGWEYLHVAVDDASRLAFTAVLPDERKESAVAFLQAALAWFAAHGVAAQRVMTDNGSAFKSQLFARAVADRGLTHKRTRPYTPRTNGKAERFIQTSIREWAYATPFDTSAERAAAMHPWLRAYNTERPHAAHKGKPPLSRLARDAMARRFAADGARIVAAGRRRDRLDGLAGNWAAPPRARPAARRGRSPRRGGAVGALPEGFAAVDVLVNNAGLARGLEPAQSADLDDWDAMVDTNVKGLMYVTRAVLPGMVARNRGARGQHRLHRRGVALPRRQRLRRHQGLRPPVQPQPPRRPLGHAPCA